MLYDVHSHSLTHSLTHTLTLSHYNNTLTLTNRNTSITLPFENKKNISRLALSPNDSLLISIDLDGRAILVNFYKKVLIAHHYFKEPVLDVQFSPCSRFIAVTHGTCTILSSVYFTIYLTISLSINQSILNRKSRSSMACSRIYS